MKNKKAAQIVTVWYIYNDHVLFLRVCFAINIQTSFVNMKTFVLLCYNYEATKNNETGFLSCDGSAVALSNQRWCYTRITD